MIREVIHIYLVHLFCDGCLYGGKFLFEILQLLIFSSYQGFLSGKREAGGRKAGGGGQEGEGQERGEREREKIMLSTAYCCSIHNTQTAQSMYMYIYQCAALPSEEFDGIVS